MSRNVEVCSGKNLAELLKAFPAAVVQRLVSKPGKDCWRVAIPDFTVHAAESPEPDSLAPEPKQRVSIETGEYGSVEVWLNCDQNGRARLGSYNDLYAARAFADGYVTARPDVKYKLT